MTYEEARKLIESLPHKDYSGINSLGGTPFDVDRLAASVPHALLMLDEFTFLERLPTYITPARNGEIQFEWHTGGVEMEISVIDFKGKPLYSHLVCTDCEGNRQIDPVRLVETVFAEAEE